MGKIIVTVEETEDGHGRCRHHSSDRVEQLLETLNGKVDQLMADIAALEAAVQNMTDAEVAGVEELRTLTDEISTLVAGEISQEKIDALTAQATAATTALTAGVEAAKSATAPPAEEAPAEGGGTPPEEGGEPPAE